MPKPMNVGDERLLDEFKRLASTHGCAPSQRELADALGCSTRRVRQRLARLAKAGVVDLGERNKERTVVVVERAIRVKPISVRLEALDGARVCFDDLDAVIHREVVGKVQSQHLEF